MCIRDRDHVFSSTSTYTNPLKAVEFFKKTKCDALAISYGTMHGANKGKDTKIRKEIAIATKECMRHEGISGFLVSHGSSTVPQYIVEEINALGGDIRNAYGIALDQLVEVCLLYTSKLADNLSFADQSASVSSWICMSKYADEKSDVLLRYVKALYKMCIRDRFHSFSTPIRWPGTRRLPSHPFRAASGNRRVSGPQPNSTSNLKAKRPGRG